MATSPSLARQARAALVPFTVTTVITALILLRTKHMPLVPGSAGSFLVKALSVLGASLYIGGISLLVAANVAFHVQGKGTLLPWDRPRHLVVTGVFRYARNPMYLGVFSMLLGQALYFNSRNLLLFLLAFVVVQAFNVPLHEERVLRKSFGQEYMTYCQNVPRWLPRLTPYEQAPTAK